MSAPGQAATVPAPYHRDAVTWGAFGALFGFGILNAVLGPVLPFLRSELGLGYLAGSLHQVAFALGGGTAGLVAAGDATTSRVVRRWSPGWSGPVSPVSASASARPSP